MFDSWTGFSRYRLYFLFENNICICTNLHVYNMYENKLAEMILNVDLLFLVFKFGR